MGFFLVRMSNVALKQVKYFELYFGLSNDVYKYATQCKKKIIIKREGSNVKFWNKENVCNIISI